MTQRIDLHRSTFLAGLSGLAALAAGGRAGAQTAPTIRIGATANDTYAEAYYAQDKGFFTAAGLTVEITTFTNGAAVSAGVASGALDIGVTNPVGLGNAVAHGIPFGYFIGGAYYSTSAPTTVLCVAKNATIKSAKDFEGQTIAVSALKDLTNLSAMEWLAKNGADVTQVKSIELAFAEMGAALERGTVAGAVISEPSLTNAVDAGQVRVFAKVFDAIAPRFLISSWFTTRDWYAKNTAVAKKLQSVYYQTARWANANAVESGNILMKYSKVSQATVQKMTRCIYAETLTPALLDPMLQLAYKAKLTDRLVTGSEIILS